MALLVLAIIQIYFGSVLSKFMYFNVIMGFFLGLLVLLGAGLRMRPVNLCKMFMISLWFYFNLCVRYDFMYRGQGWYRSANIIPLILAGSCDVKISFNPVLLYGGTHFRGETTHVKFIKFNFIHLYGSFGSGQHLDLFRFCSFKIHV